MTQTEVDKRDESLGEESHIEDEHALEDLKDAEELKGKEHTHFEKEKDVRSGVDDNDFPNILRDIEKVHLKERVGQLYSELDPTHIPELVDHIEDVKKIQDDLDTLVKAAKVAERTHDKLVDEVKRQKDTNTKLMYEQLRRSEDELKKSEDPNAELDEALANIELDED